MVYFYEIERDKSCCKKKMEKKELKEYQKKKKLKLMITIIWTS